MKRATTGLALVTVLGAAIAVGCGGKSGGNNQPGTPTPTGTIIPSTGSYLPMKPGWSWSYAVTDNKHGTNYVRDVSVGARQDVGGVHAGTQAYVVRSDYTDGSWKLEYDDDLGPVAVRYREEKYDPTGILKHTSDYVPSKLRVDQTAAHDAQGVSWNEIYDEITSTNGGVTKTTVHHDEIWTTDAVSAPVQALNGTSYNCLVQTKVGNGTSISPKTFKWSKGVGKVYEDDTGEQTNEMLQSFTPGP